MPTAPLAACAAPGCPGRAPFKKRYCAIHDTAPAQRQMGKVHASTAPYDRQWQKVRHAWLSGHPLCVMCEAEGRITAAGVVDHIEPVATHPHLRLSRGNLRSLCAPCHNAHTARTRGFGRASASR